MLLDIGNRSTRDHKIVFDIVVLSVFGKPVSDTYSLNDSRKLCGRQYRFEYMLGIRSISNITNQLVESLR